MRPATLLALLCGVAIASAAPYQRSVNGDCVPGAPTDAQLYPQQYMVVGDESSTTDLYTQIDSSRGFSVQYFPTYKVVTNSIVNETYVLLQCGAVTPDFSAFPEGAKFFQIPLTSISAPETVPYAFVEFLGLEDRVHDVSAYVTSPCGQALLQCPARTSPGFEELSNVTLLDAAVGASVDGLISSEKYDYAKAFTVSASEDPGVLSRAEWVKFVALFFNRERQASDVYAALKAEYEATKAADAPAAGAPRPVVAWAQHFKFDKDENFQLSFDAYQEQYSQDAGAAMLDWQAVKDTKGVQTDPLAPESRTLVFSWTAGSGGFASKAEAKAAFLDVLKKADVIIDESYSFDPPAYEFLTEYGLTAEEAASVPAIAAQKVFREDGRLSYSESAGYGYDWFEGAVARPGQVLKDVVRAVQPAKAQPGQTFTWIRNAFTEKPVVVTAKECDVAAPCTAQPATICPFVTLCAAGQAPAILQSSANGTCTYAQCAAATAGPANAAAMAAPAVVLTVLVVAFVEILMHFC